MPRNTAGTKRKRNDKSDKRYTHKMQKAAMKQSRKKQKTPAPKVVLPVNDGSSVLDEEPPVSPFPGLPNELIFDILSQVIDFDNLFPDEAKAFSNILNVQLASRGFRNAYLAYEAHRCRVLASSYPPTAIALLEILRNPVKTEQKCVLLEMFGSQIWRGDFFVQPALVKDVEKGTYRAIDLWLLQKVDKWFIRPWVDNARLNFKALESGASYSTIYANVVKQTEMSTAELQRFEKGIWNMYRCACYCYRVEKKEDTDEDFVLDENGEAKITNLCPCTKGCKDYENVVLDMGAIVREWPIEEQQHMFSAWLATGNILRWGNSGNWPSSLLDSSDKQPRFSMTHVRYDYPVPGICPKSMKDGFLYDFFYVTELIYDQLLDMDKVEKQLGKERRKEIKKFFNKVAEHAVWDACQADMKELMDLREEYGWPKGYDRRFYRTAHAMVTRHGSKELEKKPLLIGNKDEWGGKHGHTHMTWGVRDSLMYDASPDQVEEIEKIFASEAFQEALSNEP
ncbi:hypothetical protein BJ508DRAFT_303227 [Ascobolus immersus RN42]|uniref:Uncharacterized protein n=1 Tax=Ascobolus immersus RN42 TaxID=1160509 RepID=A0A3N4IUC3_ASCIM|nr:hypothetical protein BJ508DRAFT_303227 [Ascobolus immersus RN42]